MGHMLEIHMGGEILNKLKSGRLSAGEITDNFSVTGASISRHLSVLKEADLIRDTREGKFVLQAGCVGTGGYLIHISRVPA